MYAIFEDGSRQYRVSEGDTVVIDYRDVAKGSQLELSKVLLYQNGEETQIGKPLLTGARVLAQVVDLPSTKLYIQHFRRRKNYRRRTGHRQPFVKVKIQHILLAGQQPPPPPPPTPAPAPAATAPATAPTTTAS